MFLTALILLELVLNFFLDNGIGNILCSGVFTGARDGDIILVILLVSFKVGDHEVTRVDGLLVSPHCHCV